ncbi:unnamed protein product [Arctia plantaginis]|uniref:Cytochrome P450 n=1 Tax=Arctia plantaginis TaxID=874455 RepID=A0A8S0YV44_ARCPL|nr:unnamed protein product [Arctia plantaginis]CAB3247453.1 unnamed protein product [Arctia plantaginis]
MCETLLGTKISDTTSVDKYIENVDTLGFFYINRLVQPWYTVDFLYKTTSYYLKEQSLIRDLHNFTEEIIRKRQADLNKTVNNEKHNRIMLDILLDKVNKGNIDEKRVRDDVNTFLFESFDTTATTLIFMIVRLANESAIQKLIHEELETIFDNTDRDLTIEDLSKMKYLECCIKESLRLYPSVPFISRYITEDLTIAGYIIPKNTYYNIHIYDLHHDPDLYSDPEKFIPERFLPENSVKRHPYAYIPFSAGSRNCLGQKFAMMAMKTVLAGILRKYRLEPVTRIEDLNFMTDVILRVSHPLCVRFCLKTPVF